MTPFEIRTQLLEMAKEYLEKQYAVNTEFAKRAYDELVAQNKATAEAWKIVAPKMYTMEDVLKEAAKLYGFVSNAK